jgi:hypothetical protein
LDYNIEDANGGFVASLCSAREYRPLPVSFAGVAGSVSAMQLLKIKKEKIRYGAKRGEQNCRRLLNTKIPPAF